MRSLSLILKQGFGEDAFSKIATQFLGRAQIYFPADHCRQLLLHTREIQVSNAGGLLELHEHVHIAVWAESLRQNRTEKGQLSDLVPLTKTARFPLVELLCRGAPDSSALLWHTAPGSRQSVVAGLQLPLLIVIAPSAKSARNLSIKQLGAPEWIRTTDLLLRRQNPKENDYFGGLLI
jgi:hypothetical protein